MLYLHSEFWFFLKRTNIQYYYLELNICWMYLIEFYLLLFMNENQSNNTENDITNSGAPEPFTTPDPVIETSQSSNDATTTKKVIVRNYAIATLVILLMGGGLWLVLESQGRVQTNYLGTFANQGPAAIVNGVEISREAYESNRRQVEDSARAQGVDVTDPAIASEINAQAIETLINTEILRQEAEKLGITVLAEDVQARYDEIVLQVGGEAELAARMAELGVTEAGLRSDLEDELVIQMLFAQEANTAQVVVTDEEIMEVYTQVSAGQEEEVPLAEVREVIETNIRLSKEQDLVATYIESLRADATIEIKI
ncbi:MAG: SurA N-terminal domain-containing protein [Candidatus Paceibacteria bacterium]